MNKTVLKRFFVSSSDNPKSAIQNRKWVGIIALVVAIGVCGARVDAQQTGKVFRIGYLSGSTASGSASRLEAFWQEMRKLGWIEGKNITMEYRFAEQKLERGSELAAELVRLKVDLILVDGTGQTRAAKSVTTTIPIVMGTVGDPVGCRLGCKSSSAGRQCHRFCEFTAGAKYQKVRDTQRRNPQPHPSWIFPRRLSKRNSTERAKACGFGIEAEIGGDRSSTRPQGA